MLQYNLFLINSFHDVLTKWRMKLEPQFSKAVLVRGSPKVCSVAYPALFIRLRDYVRIRLTPRSLNTGGRILAHHYRNVVAKQLALLP